MKLRYLLFLTSTLFTSQLVFAEQSQGIHVSGKATVNAVPDTFSLRISFAERNASAEKAKLVVDNKLKQVIKRIKKLGIQDNNINTLQLTIRPIYSKVEPPVDVVYGKEGRHIIEKKLRTSPKVPKIIAYEVKRDVSVTLNQLAQYEPLLTSASKIGASHISPVRSSVSNADELYQSALMKAVAHAKSKASQMANQLGTSVGKVLQLEEISYHAPGVQMKMMESRMMADSPASYAGTNQIQAEVKAIFAIESK